MSSVELLRFSIAKVGNQVLSGIVERKTNYALKDNKENENRGKTLQGKLIRPGPEKKTVM